MASSTVETVNVHAWKRFIGNNCTGNIDLPGGHSSMGGLFRWYENVLMYDKISSPFKFIQIYPDWVHRSLIQSVQSVPPVRAIHVVVTQKWRTYFDSTSMPSPQIELSCPVQELLLKKVIFFILKPINPHYCQFGWLLFENGRRCKGSKDFQDQVRSMPCRWTGWRPQTRLFNISKYLDTSYQLLFVSSGADIFFIHY